MKKEYLTLEERLAEAEKLQHHSRFFRYALEKAKELINNGYRKLLVSVLRHSKFTSFEDYLQKNKITI